MWPSDILTFAKNRIIFGLPDHHLKFSVILTRINKLPNQCRTVVDKKSRLILNSDENFKLTGII